MSGGNGVYRYTSTPSTFPNQTWQSENYWVDVVFSEANDTTKPTVTARTPAPGADGGRCWAATSPRRSPSRCSSRPSPSSCVRPAAPSFPPRCPTTPPAAPRPSTRRRRSPPTTTYTAALSGARDPAGNQMDPVTWTLHHRHTRHDQADGDRSHPGQSAPRGSPSGVSPTATFSEAVQQATIALELRGPGNTLVPATTTYDAASRTPRSTRAPTSPRARPTPSTSAVPGRLGQPDGPGVVVVHHDCRRLGLPLHDLAVDGDTGRHRR